mgnify:CR=1 FL=1
MIQRHKKIALSLVMTSVIIFGAPLSSALNINLDTNTEDAELDSCSSAEGGLSTSLGCDTDGVIDFTTYSGSLEGPDSTGYDDALTQNADARTFIQTVVNYGLSFLGLFAVIMVIYGGVLYVLSRGDEDMASKGRKTIGYSAIGILIVLGSFAIVNTLINAGGGGGASDTLGGGLDGTTISDAGANFDVEDVLGELESVATEYIAAYETLIDIKQEVDYMNSIELPYELTLKTESKGTQGFSDKVDNALSGEGAQSSDTTNYIDTGALNDFINAMVDGAQDVQRASDNLSNAYYVANQMIGYYASGVALDEDLLSSASILSTLSKALVPSAFANDYISGAVDEISPGTCSQLIGEIEKDKTKDKTGLTSSNEYTATTEILYEETCELIAALDAAAEQDFIDSVDALASRIGNDEDEGVRALFSSDLTGASSLNVITSNLGTVNRLIALSKTELTVTTVQDIIAALDEAYSSIEQIQFVAVVLDVSATTGNAPMVVAFDVVGTEDPSGVSVIDTNIEWDLDGDGKFNTPSDASYNGGQPAQGYSVSATYEDAGSYQVRVRVKSASDEGDIAAGVAGVTVSVDPRRSQIVLDGIAGGETTEIANFTGATVHQYIDKDSYRVTEAEAESGITFDASRSLDGNDDPLAYIEWDFGDSEYMDGSWGGDNVSPTHYYSAGAYDISLTVTDNVGAEDRKFFTLYVGSPAARISYLPSTGVVGTEFNFDGSGSSTDVGSIVSYSWSISSDDGPVDLSDSGGSTLEHTFDSPGVYTVQLQVSDSSNNTDSASVSVLVESTPPVAYFECESQDESKPGTLSCDAGDSYDPDDDELSYLWDFDGEEDEDFEYLEGDETSEEVVVRFLEADSYNFSLLVTDDQEEDLQKSDLHEATYVITSVLELEMELDGDAAYNLGPDGSVDVDVIGETTGSSLEIDCGNSTSNYTTSLSGGRAILACTYETAGIYSATMKAYDEDGHSISDTQRIYIGSGEDPIAVIDVDGNGEDISFDGDTVYGNVQTKFTFDASNSVNIDGSTDSLSYSWNFGNGKTSSSQNVTTTFEEIATYTVTLSVRDKSDNSIASETSINVEIAPIPPRINGLSVIPQGDSLETPVKVTVTVDANDEDGDIEYIKAWYYDLNDTAEALGTVIAQSNEFSMTLNTNGEEGDEVSYGFAVEVTDSDNMTVTSDEELSNDEIPTLTVINGPNDSPEAHFSVDLTSIYIGEEITFVNESFDPDGEIVYSWWDIGADGVHNDEPEEGASSLSYTFTQIHPDGIDVRLKVEDNSGATSTSDTVTIFVDTLAEEPDARFLADISGTTVDFTNNSDIDEENGVALQGVYWDFDLSLDSDGNGETDDDFDSFDENPSWTYPELGVYQVMMTVVDTAGQMDTVTQDVSVLDTEDPVAAFSYSVEDKQVKYKNESFVDEDNGVDIRSYAWDFDLDYDADDDGETDNDVDSTKKSPTVEYDDFGSYEVSLTVVDTYGKEDVYQETVEVADPVQPVEAVLTSIPEPNNNGQIVLTGTEGDVTFFFNAEGGSGTFTYQFDKNIFYDTNQDGTRDNDIDYADEDSGTWTTPFFESYGTIVVELTVTDDETGEMDKEAIQVVFQGSMGGANLINATPQSMMLLILSAVLAAIGGVALIAFKPKFNN